MAGFSPLSVSGKIYKNWDSVYSVFGNTGICAKKIRKDGTVVELLITENGNKRELITKNLKILDSTDSDGFVKQTYVIKKNGDLTFGKMYTYVIHKMLSPLVTGAKWFTKDNKLQRVELAINPKHKGAYLFIAKHHNKDGSPHIIGRGKNIVATNVIAEDFDSSISPLPKTMIIRSTDGQATSIHSKTGEGNFIYASHFNITARDELGKNLRTIV